MKASGETVYHNRSWSEYLGILPLSAASRRSISARTISPRLRVNDILLASDHPQQSILCISRGKGYAQYGGMPFIMTSAHHITFKEYSKRKDTTWPPESDETLLPTLKLPPPRLKDTEPILGPEPDSEPSRPDNLIGSPATLGAPRPEEPAPEEPVSETPPPEASPTEPPQPETPETENPAAQPSLFGDLDAHFGDQTQRPGSITVKEMIDRHKNIKTRLPEK